MGEEASPDSYFFMSFFSWNGFFFQVLLFRCLFFPLNRTISSANMFTCSLTGLRYEKNVDSRESHSGN